MPRWLSIRALFTTLFLLLVPLFCGVVVLAGHAQREWSRHWVAPRTVLGSSSSYDYSAVTTQQGWDIAWTDPRGNLLLSRFDQRGRRIAADVHVKGAPNSAPQSLTMGRSGTTDVLVWRQDTANGSTLRAATLARGKTPSYRTLVSGSQPIEHPSAFASGRNVDVVFSWQHPSFNVYLAQVHVDGSASTPLALTHSTTYAFSPHAAAEAGGIIRLLYMNQCCSASAFNVLSERFTPAGKPVGGPVSLGQITSIAAQGKGASPDRWGLDVTREGQRIWGAWSSDAGLEVIAWNGAKATVPPQVLVPGALTQDLVLDTAAGGRALAWTQPFELGSYVGTIAFDTRGLPVSEPDRVAFESAADDVPSPIRLGARPAVLWQAQPTKTTITHIEMSRFSSISLDAPTVWARMGFGLANPLSSVAVLVVGSVLFGLVLTVANIFSILLCVLLFAVIFRRVRGGWKWYAYAGTLTLALYLVFVPWGAPTPPVLFLTGLSERVGIISVLGLLMFVLVLMRQVLARMDDAYKAGIMAFAAVYFIAFLQALMLIQDQIAKG